MLVQSITFLSPFLSSWKPLLTKVFIHSLQPCKTCIDANLPCWTAIPVTSVVFLASDGSLFFFVMRSVIVPKHGEMNVCWLSSPNILQNFKTFSSCKGMIQNSVKTVLDWIEILVILVPMGLTSFDFFLY